METAYPARFYHFPKVLQYELLKLITSGNKLEEIYFVICTEADFKYLLTLPLRMMGKKSDISKIIKFLENYLNGQDYLVGDETLLFWFDSFSASEKGRKIRHDNGFTKQYLTNKMWLDSCLPTNLIPFLAEAFDIKNASN